VLAMNEVGSPEPRKHIIGGSDFTPLIGEVYSHEWRISRFRCQAATGVCEAFTVAQGL
jgi:hypothetical protein